MPRRKHRELPLPEIMRRLRVAGMDDSPKVQVADDDARKEWDELGTLDERVHKLLGLINSKGRKSTNMLFFVMYDIESNKVRPRIAKYLLREGCFRIQRSIFLADLPAEKMEKIRADLTEVQACYDNHDSILVVPISTDYLQAMKVIGKSIDVDIIMQTRNTLFF